MDPAGKGSRKASASSGLRSETVEDFLTRLASASAVPGGGAAAALAGALAAALVGMVCRVTARHEPSAVEEESAARADELRRRLTMLIAADPEAYRGVLEAGRLLAPGKADALERALAAATRVPAEVAACSRDVLALCEAVGRGGRGSVLGDLGVAASLAWGALESAVLIARVNLKQRTDRTAVGAQEGELDRLTGDGARSRDGVLRIIKERA